MWGAHCPRHLIPPQDCVVHMCVSLGSCRGCGLPPSPLWVGLAFPALLLLTPTQGHLAPCHCAPRQVSLWRPFPEGWVQGIEWLSPYSLSPTASSHGPSGRDRGNQCVLYTLARRAGALVTYRSPLGLLVCDLSVLPHALSHWLLHHSTAHSCPTETK